MIIRVMIIITTLVMTEFISEVISNVCRMKYTSSYNDKEARYRNVMISMFFNRTAFHADVLRYVFKFP